MNGVDERHQRDVEEQQDAHQHDADEHDEGADGADQVGQRRGQGVAQRSPALLEVRRGSALAAEEMDEALAADEDDESAEGHGDPAVVDAGGSLDEHAGDQQQDAQQPGALAEERPQEAVDVAVEQATAGQEQRDERDGTGGDAARPRRSSAASTARRWASRYRFERRTGAAGAARALLARAMAARPPRSPGRRADDGVVCS